MKLMAYLLFEINLVNALCDCAVRTLSLKKSTKHSHQREHQRSTEAAPTLRAQQEGICCHLAANGHPSVAG